MGDLGKVFIISFNKDEAKKIGHVVGSAGFAVMGISNQTEDAIYKLSSETPDVIILDGRFVEDERVLELATKVEEKYGIPYFLIIDSSFSSMVEVISILSAQGIIKDLYQAGKVNEVLRAFFEARPSIEEDKTLLVQPIKSDMPLTSEVKIIGRTSVFRKALGLADQVAETDASVLIMGETGTGKELFARYIHEKSLRSKHKMISLNCSAIPDHLLESELFGHEKGSFTGADSKRIGKFQLAHNGTIFLDEVGELPYDSQAKLLRFLQEKTIDSIGSDAPEKIDVRIITATNRNLKQSIKQGNFRDDLYFRLNAFPITIPPLRDRKADITELAYFFLEKSSAKLSKEIDSISENTLKIFEAYEWPGNIRELENVIERGTILCDSNMLDMKSEDIFTDISSRRNGR